MLRANSFPISTKSIQPFFTRGTLALFKLAHQPQESNDFLIFINSKNFPTAAIGNFSKLFSGNSLDFFADNGI